MGSLACGFCVVRKKDTTTVVDGWGAGIAGDLGYADVATTSLRPLDEGHLKAAAAPDAASRSRPGAGGPFSRALDAIARSAADAAKGPDYAVSTPILTLIEPCYKRQEDDIGARKILVREYKFEALEYK